MKLVYSQDAITDLVRLRAFIAEHDPSAAARIAADLRARIDTLCAFPMIGRSVGRAPDPGRIRDLFAANYVVRYAVQHASVVVLRIWHHHEDRSSGP